MAKVNKRKTQKLKIDQSKSKSKESKDRNKKIEVSNKAANKRLKNNKRKQEVNKEGKRYYGPKIKIIGVGGAGGNIIARIRKKRRATNIEYLAINTDKQALANLPRPIKKIIIGRKITHGLGTGMNPDIGREAALIEKEVIKNELKGADIIFILAGFGGGTGSGATPVISQIAKELGVLTIVLATSPFSFEGPVRLSIAENSFKEVLNSVDTAIFLSNEQLFSHLSSEVSLVKGFDLADDIFAQGILGIFDILTEPGLINLDFADLKAVLKEGGQGILVSVEGKGKEKKEFIIKDLLKSIPANFSLKDSERMLYSICGGRLSSFKEIQEIIEKIKEISNSQAKIIFGLSSNPKLNDQIRLTLIATSLKSHPSFVSINHHQQESKEKKEGTAPQKLDKEKKPEPLEEAKPSGLYEELDIPAFIRRRLHR